MTDILHGEREADIHTSNGNSEKSSDDSVGQELSKSMMTLLLPQALPLLKKSYGRKRAKVHTSKISFMSGDASLKSSEENNGTLHNAGILSSGTVTVGTLEGSPKEVHCLDTTRHLDTQNLENVTSVVPDSFEDEHIGQLNCQKTLSSDFVEADELYGIKNCNPENLIGNSSATERCLNIHVGTHKINATCYDNAFVIGNDILKKDGILGSDSHLSVPTNRQVDLQENFENVILDSDQNSLRPELCSMTSDQLKDVPAFEATLSIDNENQPCRAGPNVSLADELPSRGDRCSTDVDALTSEMNVAEAHPLKHANNTGNSNKENKKIIPFRRRNLTRGKKLQNSNDHENQYDNATKQLSSTKDAGTSVCDSARQMPKKGVDLIETRNIINSNSSSIQISDVHSTGIYRPPFSESILFRNTKEGCAPEMATLLATDIGPIGASVDSLHSKRLFEGKVKLDAKQDHLSGETGTIRSNNVLSDAQPVVNCASKDSDIVGKKEHQAEIIVDGDGSLLLCQEREKNSISDDNVHGITEHLVMPNLHPRIKLVTDNGNLSSRSELHKKLMRSNKFISSGDTKPSKASEDFVDLIGCYMQPAPILSVVLSTQGEDIHISVLCGILADRLRNIFVYKVPLKQPRRGEPSFLGYTSIVLPNSKYTFSGEIAFERFPLQFTPDGQMLIFSNSFKAPHCREQSIDCLCSVCTTHCCEENAIKIIHVKLGYITLVAKFKTEDSIHSILVCEPSHLVALKRNGEVKVWAMNSIWSEKVDEFVLPSLDHMSSCLVELKKIPKYPLLIVGHNEFGDFGLWDISKRIILSRFSAPCNCVFQFQPVGLFGWKNEYVRAQSVEEQIKGIMTETKRWFSENSEDRDFLSFEGDNIAVWLLVYAVRDSEVQYDHRKNGADMSTNGSWRLALLVDNMLILGSALDPRASLVDKLDGHGIIGTHDGLVYIWNLSTGLRLTDLHHFKSGRVSCICADSKSGVLAVAGDESQLMVYEILHTRTK